MEKKAVMLRRERATGYVQYFAGGLRLQELPRGERGLEGGLSPKVDVARELYSSVKS